MLPLPSIGVLVGPKGRGTNFRSIVEACERGDVPAQVTLLVTPSASLPATDFARNHEIPVHVIEPGEHYEADLQEAIEGCDMICLAGFMRLLPDGVLRDHPQRVLNIHPALLPKFGGKGMYGIRVHKAVVASGETESGCTVHYVTERYDEGEIILQMSCPIYPQDTAEELAARVLQLETQAYPAAIRKVLSGATS